MLILDIDGRLALHASGNAEDAPGGAGSAVDRSARWVLCRVGQPTSASEQLVAVPVRLRAAPSERSRYRVTRAPDRPTAADDRHL